MTRAHSDEFERSESLKSANAPKGGSGRAAGDGVPTLLEGDRNPTTSLHGRSSLPRRWRVPRHHRQANPRDAVVVSRVRTWSLCLTPPSGTTARSS
jgi:hypothetical protein